MVNVTIYSIHGSYGFRTMRSNSHDALDGEAGQKMQEPVTVVSTHLDVWAEMRRAWHGMVTRRDHRNSRSKADFKFIKRFGIFEKSFSVSTFCDYFFRNFLPDFSQLGLFARVFCWFFQGILRHGGGWSHPAAGVWSPAPSPSLWWDVWWDVWWPCGHPGGFQYGRAEQRDPVELGIRLRWWEFKMGLYNDKWYNIYDIIYMIIYIYDIIYIYNIYDIIYIYEIYQTKIIRYFFVKYKREIKEIPRSNGISHPGWLRCSWARNTNDWQIYWITWAFKEIPRSWENMRKQLGCF